MRALSRSVRGAARTPHPTLRRSQSVSEGNSVRGLPSISRAMARHPCSAADSGPSCTPAGAARATSSLPSKSLCPRSPGVVCGQLRPQPLHQPCTCWCHRRSGWPPPAGVRPARQARRPCAPARTGSDAPRGCVARHSAGDSQARPVRAGGVATTGHYRSSLFTTAMPAPSSLPARACKRT